MLSSGASSFVFSISSLGGLHLLALPFLSHTRNFIAWRLPHPYTLLSTRRFLSSVSSKEVSTSLLTLSVYLKVVGAYATSFALNRRIIIWKYGSVRTWLGLTLARPTHRMSKDEGGIDVRHRRKQAAPAPQPMIWCNGRKGTLAGSRVGFRNWKVHAPSNCGSLVQSWGLVSIILASCSYCEDVCICTLKYL